MKTIKKILLLLPLTLAVAGCESGNQSSSHNQGGSTSQGGYDIEILKPVEIKSLKEGLVYLNTSYNYTLSYYNSTYGNCSLIFTRNSIGFSASKSAYATTAVIRDNVGIYPLDYDNGYTAGEYYLDDDGNYITDLWGSGIKPNLRNVSTDYINNVDGNINSLIITNKTFKIAFIQTVGYSANDYVNVDELEVYYDGGQLKFSLLMATSKNPIGYVMENVGTSVNEDVKNFLDAGGKALKLSEDLKEMRRLMKLDNFLRYIYDINENQYVGYELFNEHYFYSETIGIGNGSGAIALNQRANDEHSNDLRGCYLFNTVGNLISGFTNISLYPMPIFDKPDVTQLYHYPRYLALFENMQYIYEGTVDVGEGGAYIPNGKSYRIDNLNMIYDFISNFSIDQSYDPATCVPYALTIDIDLASNQTESTVVFVYYFTYNNALYTMPIPFTNFGGARVDLFDRVYEQYND